jgi:hypothetical protein
VTATEVASSGASAKSQAEERLKEEMEQLKNKEGED